MADKGQLASSIGYTLGVASALYGLIKGYVGGRDIVTDWIDRWKNPGGYAVRATINKTIIREERTEFIKLRTVRAHRRLESLTIDHRPMIVRHDGTEQPAVISNCSSVPGRTTLTPDAMIRINLEEDEQLSAHKDHSVFLAYTFDHKLHDLFVPPGVIVQPPVGSEFVVIEVQFPENRRLLLDIERNPQIRLYARNRTTEASTTLWPSRPGAGRRLVEVHSDPLNFNWLRARIAKPPQDSDIHLDWQWEEHAVEKPQ